ncbi:polysaccharide deacetylase family protein [Streptomyces sp. O3]
MALTTLRKPNKSVPQGTALAGAALASLLLSGCSSYDSTTPSDARGKAADGAEVAAGAVDCAKAKCIALTFDGGPGPKTPELLETLKKEKVPATFFLLGKKHIERYPDTVRAIADADEGHELANHTWTHPRLPDVSEDEIRRELSRTQDEVKRLTGVTPTLMRPPQGRTDDKVEKVCKELGLSQVLWSTTAKDYKTNDSALIQKRTLDQAGRDGIILLHDIYRGTVPAVPGIITELKKRGYTFVTVTDLLSPAKPEPGKVYKP